MNIPKAIPPKKRKQVSEVIDLLEDVPLKPQAPKKSKVKPKTKAVEVTAPSKPKATPKPKAKAKRVYKKPEFRKDTCNWFLTVPQYKGTQSIDDVMIKLKKFCQAHKKELISAIVSLEDHGPKSKEEGGLGIETTTDPGVHFHVCFKVDPRWNVKNPKWFNGIFDDHQVHIEGAKNYQAVCVYSAKDGNYVTHNLSIDAFRLAIKRKIGVSHIIVANHIKDNPNVKYKELNDKFPEYLIQHQKKTMDYITFCQTIYVETVPYPGIDDYSTRNKPTQLICEWLEKNLFPAKRLHKQKQLYIYGPTDIRKSSLLMKLSESFNTYDVGIEANEAFWTKFHDNYELAVFDEFDGNKTIAQMNAFTEGKRVNLACKGGDAIMKIRNIPVIVCSNKSLEEVYAKVIKDNPKGFEALKGRFLIVDCSTLSESDPIDIPWKQTPVVDLEKSNDALVVPVETIEVLEQVSDIDISDCECDEDGEDDEDNESTEKI